MIYKYAIQQIMIIQPFKPYTLCKSYNNYLPPNNSSPTHIPLFNVTVHVVHYMTRYGRDWCILKSL